MEQHTDIIERIIAFKKVFAAIALLTFESFRLALGSLRSNKLRTFLTPEQYLEIEGAADFRSEFLNGQMFALSEAGLRHSVEVQAESLYEAALLALKVFQAHDC